MVSKFLLPNKFKMIGLILFIPSFILGILWLAGIGFDIQAPAFILLESSNDYLTIHDQNIYDEILASFTLISLMMITFSLEKNEDEYIHRIRLDSLIWAVYVNFIILQLTILLLYEFAFYNVMVLNMYTIQILFVIRFNIILYNNKRKLELEK